MIKNWPMTDLIYFARDFISHFENFGNYEKGVWKSEGIVENISSEKKRIEKYEEPVIYCIREGKLNAPKLAWVYKKGVIPKIEYNRADFTPIYKMFYEYMNNRR
jgi:hypothetical protein